ncbi:hypothetical protein chiPu_0029049, partial [Chiloscyllium punctatum]|nr:hypothetical protein [Chiloscyllium punctatum]
MAQYGLAEERQCPAIVTVPSSAGKPAGIEKGLLLGR